MLQNSPVPFRIDILKTDSSQTTMSIFLSEIFISANLEVIRRDQSIVTFLSESYYGISLALQRSHSEFLIKQDFWLHTFTIDKNKEVFKIDKKLPAEPLEDIKTVEIPSYHFMNSDPHAKCTPLPDRYPQHRICFDEEGHKSEKLFCSNLQNRIIFSTHCFLWMTGTLGSTLSGPAFKRC